MSQYDYDLLVIGAGSGGVRAARVAGELGKKVAVFESDRVGGTCVIRGCVPKKLLAYASQYQKAFKAAESFGWKVSAEFSWPSLIANKNKEIDRLNGIYLELLKKAGVELIPYHARFCDHHTIEANGEKYTAETILVATGGRPAYPTNIIGVEHVINSDDVFSLEKLPGSITIYGAGYVGVEFASIFNLLGVKVNLVYYDNYILNGFDHQIRKWAQEAYIDSGINVILNTSIQSISYEGSTKSYLCKTNNQPIHSDMVLFATGRKPNTDSINLRAADIETDRNGYIKVDRYQRVAGSRHIYAIGDISTTHQLTPVAIREAQLLVERLYKQSKEVVEYDHIPTAVFSQPEIAVCGLTEEQARKKYASIKCHTSSFRAMKYAMTDIYEKTFMKLIFNQKTGVLLGCHIIGADAAEMIQGFSAAMKKAVTKNNLQQTMALHPTSAEELVTMI